MASALLLATLLATTASKGQAPTAPSASESDQWFAYDKALHFGFSAGLAASGYTMGACISQKRATRLAIGAGVAILAGIAKELWDLSGHGDPSWKDLFWDAMGTGAGLGISWTIDWSFSAETAREKDVRQQPVSLGVVGRGR